MLNDYKITNYDEESALHPLGPHWAQIMLKKQRKTLIVCPAYHDAIHSR